MKINLSIIVKSRQAYKLFFTKWEDRYSFYGLDEDPSLKSRIFILHIDYSVVRKIYQKLPN